MPEPNFDGMIRQDASTLDLLLDEIRACRLCADHLPLGPRPVLQAGAGARLLIVGQAPGSRVHRSGVPFDDPSGERLRDWLGVSREIFYDADRVALVPAGFCYPGKGGGGDLPPRPECAPTWQAPVRRLLPRIGLTLLVGAYAQALYLGRGRRPTLTATARAWRDFAPDFWPIPHPSPRNTAWFKHHPWFEAEVVPALRERIRVLLALA
jgi:uracil-DNA glycosylase